MTLPRRIRLALQIALLVVLWGIWAVVTDERCSRNVSELDLTFEEVFK